MTNFHAAETATSGPGALATGGETREPVAPLWQMLLAAVWLIGFGYAFYQFDLPNSDPKINRMQVWQQLPALIVNSIDPPEPAAQDVEARQLWKQAGWRNLPQRFPLYGTAAVILIGAWACGSLWLRCLRIPLPCWTLDRAFLSLLAGLSLVSLMTLLCGLAGYLSPTLMWGLLGTAVGLECLVRLFTFSSHDLSRIMRGVTAMVTRQSWPFWVCLPFLMCYIGGAFLPEIDFDVKEYHFGGPKEWYLAGRITFLPHNVYTSFPFLTEMLVLQGMVLHQDWYWGAIAGKGVLMCFGPVTALGIFVAGRRWFSTVVGTFGALIHLSTPWIYRISIIAYAEGGLAAYLFAALVAVLFLFDPRTRMVASEGDDAVSDRGLGWTLLAGFLAGSGMACKYPGLISVVIPLGLAVAWYARRGRRDQGAGQSTDPERAPLSVVRMLIVFGIGVLIAIGPWLAKNWWETGNPVYPLMYRVFGGTDWDAELNAKWRRGHSPDDFSPLDLAEKLMDVTLKSDWLGPLLFGLAPLALLRFDRRRQAGLWIFVGYLFATWWLLTHRIDRFWVPLIPVVSLLAGAGAAWNGHRVWRRLMGVSMTLAMLYNLGFMTTSLCGYNAYLLELSRAAEQTARLTSPEVVQLNAQLPPDAKVLCVGEAELFDARFAYAYNTVFDKSLFEEWCGTPDHAIPAAERPLKTTEEIRAVLREHKITHLLINWQEILRYRLTYGYTDFVTPRRFEELRKRGVLAEPWGNTGARQVERMSPRELQEVQRWAPELITPTAGKSLFRTFDVYPVVLP